ncbi:MAG TPA: hypothetical protein VD886_05645 [Herpetosiphonaceae bacterium]|nr:hypothetical protein [Herpetosiphonaceae bacterium]
MPLRTVIAWAQRLLLGAVGLIMLVLVLAVLPTQRRPLAGIAIGSGFDYTNLAAWGQSCEDAAPPSLLADCTFPLRGETLSLRLTYTDPMRNFWTGCAATYRGASVPCRFGINGVQYALFKPEDLGITPDERAGLARRHAVVNMPESRWFLILQGCAGATAVALALRFIRQEFRLVRLALGAVAGYCWYWVAISVLIVASSLLNVVD